MTSISSSIAFFKTSSFRYTKIASSIYITQTPHFFGVELGDDELEFELELGEALEDDDEPALGED